MQFDTIMGMTPFSFSNNLVDLVRGQNFSLFPISRTLDLPPTPPLPYCPVGSPSQVPTSESLKIFAVFDRVMEGD